ncbi:unnamed protein product [Dracunculus medinensis]|uniref:Protein YIF1 n=1 Tax=Dracunculus medinensis TaxID=318479 RepID=A0A0N4UJF4_DRAME|nr:unnamed protein product [Dracunculus medinensis]
MNTGYQPFHQQAASPVGYYDISTLPGQLMSDPMFNMARQIGGQFAEQQKEKLSKYLSAFKLKYYFAVDNAYVGKKLAILTFPFFHKQWNVMHDDGGQPVPARFDVNAPDLYIPLMAFITYVLISGFVLGVQGRFTPEQLGIITTNALVYLLFENVILFVTRYIMNISEALTVWHTLAYSSYKFVGMNISLLASFVGGKTAYYSALIYMSLAVVFFLVSFFQDGGRKRKLYLIIYISFTQPLLMWLLTRGVATVDNSSMNLAQMALSGMGLGQTGIKSGHPLLPDDEIDYEALLKKFTHLI